MTIIRTLLTIIVVIASVFALSNLMLDDVHIVWSHSADNSGLLEPFVAAVVIAFVVALLIAIGLFTTFVIGGVLITVAFVVSLALVVALLPAIAPLVLVIGGIWLIINLFKEAN